MSTHTNSVSYNPGYAPIGEVRDMRSQQGQGDSHQLPVHRYGRKRPLSNKAKLVLMRKCKR